MAAVVGTRNGVRTGTIQGAVAYRHALEMFSARVRSVAPGQWNSPTPCPDWDVRALVNHLTVEQLWAVPLLRGATPTMIGRRFDGDQLGEEPVAAWSRAAEAALTAWDAPCSWERTVNLSAGPTSSAEYGFQMTADLLIHGWDLARAIGVNQPFDPDLVRMVLVRLEPEVERWRRMGIFGPYCPVAVNASDMTRLLALTGRRADWRPPRRLTSAGRWTSTQPVGRKACGVGGSSRQAVGPGGRARAVSP
ncbi:TIGR03086 family metal-binding protein [Frankia sp. Cppng1_Ct_nod]|uniref:TIGR03086 family metal-binding protein n=1 Tax=Frankia sp. Cppng1_Ct_nod TaxID=2897162 RepID=UPI0010410FEA|nr:TIGR03086 family metal-binding protein [Frankia sp. Cppng1_Ct_nod]